MSEASYLHSCLFETGIDAETSTRYEKATGLILANHQPSLAVTRVVERHLDAEAVEYALRRRGLGADLRLRLQILCYLAEPRQEYLSEFVNLRAARGAAWSALIGSALHSVWKLIKGEYLIRRHGLV